VKSYFEKVTVVAKAKPVAPPPQAKAAPTKVKINYLNFSIFFN